MEVDELTEQETALYDRQLRIWGADAQRRLRKCHILVHGINGTIAEFCKNMVLAGIGNLTLMDDRAVTEMMLHANFLIPPDENVYGGKSIAEICCDSLKEFNPMVKIFVQKGNLSGFDEDFISNFNAVILTSCPLEIKKLVDEKCRKSLGDTAFYAVSCRDSCGEIFVDLKKHKYSKKKDGTTTECELYYPSLQEAISGPWSSLPKKVSKLYFAMRVIEKFEDMKAMNSGGISSEDLPLVIKLKNDLCDAQGVSQSLVPDDLMERLITSTSEFPPVCAILGGILGQEVIKAISGTGEPIKNFLFYDVADGKAKIEDISGASCN